MYLRNSLQGDVYRLHSPNNMYNSLWTALHARYEMKQIIAEQHIGELFKLKPINGASYAELRELLDKVNRNVQILETYDLTLNLLSQLFLVSLVTSRLDGETRKSFELQQNAQVFPMWQDTELGKFYGKFCYGIKNFIIHIRFLIDG
jgi:hypothetical protein